MTNWSCTRMWWVVTKPPNRLTLSRMSTDWPSLVYQFCPSVVFLPSSFASDKGIQTYQKDGELFHTSDLWPQRAVGQFGCRNCGNWLLVEREQHPGCWGQEKALSSQVRPHRVTSSAYSTRAGSSKCNYLVPVILKEVYILNVQKGTRSALDRWHWLRSVNSPSPIIICLNNTETRLFTFTCTSQNDDSTLSLCNITTEKRGLLMNSCASNWNIKKHVWQTRLTV